MKTHIILTSIFLILGMLIFVPSQAQTSKTSPSSIIPETPIPLKTNVALLKKKSTKLTLTSSSLNKVKKLSKGEIIKLKASPTLKRMYPPLEASLGSTTFRFTCSSSADCNQCNMYWFDKNKDGKVTPMSELYCACPTGGYPCAVFAVEVE